ncbi:MAG: alpha/beta hydrolase, partial [Novosphingobium sp.]|nr:alpha/beta hydrolase [Novosphingobium sp.]
MRSLAVIIFAIMAFAARPLTAQEIVYETVELEEAGWLDGGSERYLSAQQSPVPQAIAAYGPFRVLDDARAALVDVTDSRSPGAFQAMLRHHPGIAVIEMIDCPGTEDDRANLELGRMIRARGIATHVPAGGSVRSGAVELFLAGARRLIDDGAEFAVHAWIDEDGRQADDYALNAPENRKYLAYYREMGMREGQARAFYAMTNS